MVSVGNDLLLLLRLRGSLAEAPPVLLRYYSIIFSLLYFLYLLMVSVGNDLLLLLRLRGSLAEAPPALLRAPQ